MTNSAFIATLLIIVASLRSVPACTSDQIKRVKKDGKELGRGVQGAVFLVSNTEVVKVLEMPPEDPAVAEAEREIKIMSALKDYPLTVRFNESCEVPANKAKGFYIFMERCEAELFDYLDGVEASPRKYYEIMLDLLRIFVDINAMGVFHIDNQPRNVMQCGGQLKLIDFGKGFINTQPTNKRQRGIEIMNLANLFRNIRERMGVPAPELDGLFDQMKAQGLLARKNSDLTLGLEDIKSQLTKGLSKASSIPVDPASRRFGDFIVADPNQSIFWKFASITKMLLSPIKKLKQRGQTLLKRHAKGETSEESAEEEAVFEPSEETRQALISFEQSDFADEAAWKAIEEEMAPADLEEQVLDNKSLKI